MDYTDVLIRIQKPTEADPTQYPVEAQIDGSGAWQGMSQFDFDTLDPGRLSPQEYGLALGKQLLNSSVRRALEQAGVGQGKRVRIRLQVDKDVTFPRALRWERMYIDVGDAPWHIATSPYVPFSRYIPQERTAAAPTEDTVFRLLLAIANPSDLDEKLRIDVGAEIGGLLEEFGATVPTARFRVRVLPGRSSLSEEMTKKLAAAQWDIADGNATLDNISKWLHKDGGYHALHLIAHGNFNPSTKEGVLHLEGNDGVAQKVKDYELQSWIHPRLQLAVFQACKTAAQPPPDELPYVGIAPKIVQWGIPAVIAMQDFVLMTDARAFAAAFYRGLMREGLVDVAINEGRQAMSRSATRVDASIPALFMRLQAGRLWRPDAVRSDVADTRERLGPAPEALPLKVVQHARGLSYDAAQGPEGPLFGLAARLDDLVDEQWLTCLTGPAGFDKTAHLHLQFLRLAELYLSAQRETAPFWVTLTELADWNRLRAGSIGADLRAMMQAVAARQAVPRELRGRSFVFLVQADQDLSDQADKDAIDTLLVLLGAFPDSRALLVYDEGSLSNLRDQIAGSGTTESALANVALLVVQPMAWTDLEPYLIAQKETRLVEVLEGRQLTDLAAAPWILTQLRALATRGRFPVNRADALRLIAGSALVSFDTRRAPRSCAEQALERIAWRLQIDRRRALDSEALLSILAEVRDRRDFRFDDLSGGLVGCQILASSGEDGVRFTYRAVQAYFAARFLQKTSRKWPYVEDVTAALGRYSRVRHWEDVLIALAGLQESVADQILLLEAIVWGSSLAEGEQVFLAARMYMEMAARSDVRAQPRPDAPTLADSKVVRQILDTMAWRMRGDTHRPYADRRQAAERLSQMRHPDAVEHLIVLAVDRTVASDSAAASGARRFDNAGMRMTAVGGLLLQADATRRYVGNHRPELLGLIDAWEALAEHEVQPIVAILEAKDPSQSVVAVFALAHAGMKMGGPPLVDLFFRLVTGRDESQDNELTWAMVEVFGRQESQWLFKHVISRWLKLSPPPDRRLCYLIQKYGQAPAGSGVREYLDACLRGERLEAQDRGLRALAKLNDSATNTWLRELCYHMIAGDWAAVVASGRIGLREEPTGKAAARLTQAALEMLRDIGDEESIKKIRSSRIQSDPELFQLSFQVSEQLYWRVTGGLAKEDFNAIAKQRV